MTSVPDLVFPFEFVSRRPCLPLGRFVESIWYARGTVPYTREKIAPTGSTVAVIVLGDPIVETPSNGGGRPLRTGQGFLTGPHDGPAINEPTGETYAVGIVATPIGCEPLFGWRPSNLRGRVVELTSAWRDAMSLRSQLLELDNAAKMLDVVETHLRASCAEASEALIRCERAVELLEANPTQQISDIASQLGVSHGHLDAEFTRVVGLSPRALARLLRMRLLLAKLDAAGEYAWADLAAEFGWFDQAHLIRDFKRHTGVTPTQYVKARSAVFGPDRGVAGFVPEF